MSLVRCHPTRMGTPHVPRDVPCNQDKHCLGPRAPCPCPLNLEPLERPSNLSLAISGFSKTKSTSSVVGTQAYSAVPFWEECMVETFAVHLMTVVTVCVERLCPSQSLGLFVLY